ncbi:Fungalysin metallopeptidase-domain-containing protein [Gaertneriomyces semiglobifer]|nr:Fungalysin metallopeptidase-domain-containing protein [Gaertneriomyces semiglobifer]KAI9005230.1 Fungalysin metallopeptidase-domain-containing protein [Gaertneriomyces semiglobifer]
MQLTPRVLLAFSLLSGALAAPAPRQPAAVPASFNRSPTFESVGGVVVPVDGFGEPTDAERAATFISERTNIPASELTITDEVENDLGIKFVYLARTVDGYKVANQVANVAFRDSKVISYGSNLPTAASFAPEEIAPSNQLTDNLEQAIQLAESTLGVPRNSAAPRQQFIETAAGKLEYVHTFQLQTPKSETDAQWLEVHSSVASGEVVRVDNWINKASYTVVDFRSADPTKGLVTVKDPADTKASPKGWHDDGKKTYTETIGNNAYAYKLTQSGGLFGKATKKTAQSATNQYLTKYDIKTSASTANNLQASIVNNFYIVNMMHDLFYNYGFTEKAGNFQTNNFGKGGQGGDAVSVSVQDPEGTNNAYFGSPPDGEQPEMGMFIWDKTSPTRDGGMDNAIPIHEYMHGVSNRLTGGPANANCLRQTESGGMGEGWSDAAALIIGRKGTDTRETNFAVGAWSANNSAGIRKYPYSTDMKINPHTYSFVATTQRVHAIGEVWAAMWNEVYWNLVDKYGYSDDIFNSNQQKGNIMTLRLLVDALQIQPCNPTFVQARDAVLEADAQRYGGKNYCDIWKAFAKRGLGVAAENLEDDFTVPAKCK